MPSGSGEPEQRRFALMQTFFDASKPAREKMLKHLRDIIKESAVADPDMCDVAARAIRRSIDMVWADIMISIDIAVRDMGTDSYGNYDSLTKAGAAPTLLSPRWWRARLLYCFLPFDRSIFGQLRDPVFWYLCFVTLVMTYGVRVGFGFLLLVCLCAGGDPDEFQLVTYILMFKGTTFLSSGVVGSYSAAFGYWKCVRPDGTHTCHLDGPAARLDIVSSMVDFIGTCTLVFAAFVMLLMGKSVHHGYKKMTAEEWKQQYGEGLGGTHIRWLLTYDCCCVVLTVCIFFVINVLEHMAFRDSNSPWECIQDIRHWNVHRAVFFGQIAYGLMSCPFLLFRLPVLNNILCHTAPTGYNKNGVCVPFLLRPMKPS